MYKIAGGPKWFRKGRKKLTFQSITLPGPVIAAVTP